MANCPTNITYNTLLYIKFLIYGKAFAVQGTRKAMNEVEDWMAPRLHCYYYHILYFIVYIYIKLNRCTGDA